MIRAMCLALCVLALPAAAVPIETSSRPVLRPAPQFGLGASLRPFLRSLQRQPTARSQPAAPQPTAEPAAVTLPSALTVKRPESRPKRLRDLAIFRRNPEQPTGRLCGQPGIEGEIVGNVPGRIRGCGVQDAVRVTSVAGVQLSTAAVMDCNTAKAVHRWMQVGAKPAFGNRGGGLEEVRVAAHYICRTRNNQPGARISEHGKGRAIDISAFTLKDGNTVTVLKGWNNPRYRDAMRTMHREACGPFGTVLGPNADRFHRDHFHFDTAQYRSGPYCR